MTTTQPKPNPLTRPVEVVVGENLKRLRANAALTQEYLAEKAGHPVRTLQRAEAGQPVKTEALVCFAQVLGVELDVLRFDFENPPAELKAQMDDFIAQATGTGPWRHVQCKRVIKATEVEALFHAPFCASVSSKDESLTMEAMDLVAEISQSLIDMNDLDLEATHLWEASKSLAATLEALDLEGAVMMAGRLDVTYDPRTPEGARPQKWPMLLLAFQPKDKIRSTMAYDLRNLGGAFREARPSSWTPIPGVLPKDEKQQAGA